MYGAYGDPLSLTKPAFFVLYMYRGASKHHSNIWGVSKHTGCIQTYRGIQTYGGPKHTGGIKTYMGHSNIWGASKCIGTYSHPLSLTKHTFFVLCMYRGHPNIWGHIFCIILNYISHLVFINFKYFYPFFKIFL